MGNLILVLLAAAGILAFVMPWIGIVAAYFIAILNPQSIWFWSFQGERPALWTLLPTFISFSILALAGKIDFKPINNMRSAMLFALVITGVLSMAFGPFAINDEELGTRSSGFIVANLTIMVMTALMASVLIRKQKQLDILGIMFVAVGIYMTWWINERYLIQGVNGRIGGPNPPGGGLYDDENSFAALFVAAMPFVVYYGYGAKSKVVRYALWFTVPLMWHAIFLTGSRGGLIALAVSMIVMAIRSENKKIGVAILVVFAAVFVWQGGSVMKERIVTVADYENDESAVGRTEAWKAALNMMYSNPLTGVGPAAFLRAYTNYHDALPPRQAHNTFFQFGGEFGPLAAIAYALMVISALIGLIQNSRLLVRQGMSGSKLYLGTEAIIAALSGLTVAQLFLSAQLSEILYFLIFMTNASIAITQTCINDVSCGIERIR